MTLSSLLEELDALNIVLWLNVDDQLHFRAPKGSLSDHLRAKIQQHKPDIIDVLKQRQINQAPEHFKLDTSNFDKHVTVFACSPIQERMWFLQQFIGNKSTYNVSAAFHLFGPLNTAYFNQAWQQIIQQHDIFRSQFFQEKNHLKQRVHKNITWRTFFHDISHQTEIDIPRILEKENQHQFNLKSNETFDPLIKVSIYRLNRDLEQHKHLIIINQHHIITDAWSMQLLLKELSTRYNALVNNKPLDTEVAQESDLYFQYIHWQNKWALSENKTVQLDYWKQQLKDLPLLELPTSYTRPATFSYRGNTHRFSIEPFLVTRARQLAQQENSSLFMCFLATFSILLSKYSGQEDFAIATPIANRNEASTQSIIGCLINTLAIRCQPSGSLTFKDYLSHVKQHAVDAYQHQSLPFETLVDELNLPRDTAFTPVCQTLFTLQEESSQAEVQLDNLHAEPIPVDSHSSKFDLSLDLQFNQQQLQASIEFNKDLFSTQFIKDFAQHFQTLLAQLLDNPTTKISAQHYLTSEQVQTIINSDQTQHLPIKSQSYLHTAFAAQAQRTPQATAIVDSKRSWTYKEVLSQALLYAHTLKILGVKEGDYVALCTAHHGEFIALSLAAMYNGCVYIPISHNTPATRIEFIIKDSRANFLIAEQHKLVSLALGSINNTSLEELNKQSQLYQDINMTVPDTSQEDCYCIYTSGSTGTPKGCIVSHSNVARLFTQCQTLFNISSHDKGTFFHSNAFDFSIWENI